MDGNKRDNESIDDITINVGGGATASSDISIVCQSGSYLQTTGTGSWACVQSVGIGTTTPGYKLDVIDSTAPLARIKRSPGFNYVFQYVSSAYTDITDVCSNSKGDETGDVIDAIGDYIYFGSSTKFSSPGCN